MGINARNGEWHVVAQQTGGVCVRVSHKQADVEVPQELSRLTQLQAMALNSGWVEGSSACLSHCSAVRRHHDRGTYYERKHLMENLLTVTEV